LKKASKTIDTLKCDIDNLQAAQNIKNTYSAVKAASQIANESFEVKSKECKEQIRLYQTDIKEKRRRTLNLGVLAKLQESVSKRTDSASTTTKTTAATAVHKAVATLFPEATDATFFSGQITRTS